MIHGIDQYDDYDYINIIGWYKAMKKTLIIVLAVFITMCMMTGCVNKKFIEAYDEFKRLYVSANDYLDIEKDPLGTVTDTYKYIDIDEYQKAFDSLKINLDNMKKNAKTKTEKVTCDRAETSLTHMECILTLQKNADNLSEEEVDRLRIAFARAGDYRHEFKRSNK